jgi:hypothetical protein
MLKTVSSITNALGALNYKGTWNASTNSPALSSGAGTKGDYYVVSVAGTTSLDGISNWGVGDWATFNGSVWQRVEGGADLNGVNLSASGTVTFSSLTGYLKGNGASQLTASSTIPNTDVSGLGTMSTQAASNVAITGGSVNGTTIGASTRSTGNFTSIDANNGITASNNTPITATNPTGGTGGLKLYNPSNNTNASIARFFGWDGSQTGSIRTYVNATTYDTSSDQRLKDDIGVATDTSVIDNTVIHDFTWKHDGMVDRGVFAQEAYLVKPTAVGVGEDSLTESGSLAVPWCVDYSKYIPDIIVHAQQLKKRVEELEARLAALESKQ